MTIRRGAAVTFAILSMTYALAPAARAQTPAPARPLPAPTPLATPMAIAPRAFAPGLLPVTPEGPALSLTGKGSVTRAADRAVVNVLLTATGPTLADVISAISAATSALQRSLDHVRGATVSVENIGVNRFGFGEQAQPFNGSAQVEVRVDDLALLAAVRGTVAGTAGASVGNIRYDLANRADAFGEALAAAGADLRAQLANFTAKSGVRVVSERQTQAYANNVQTADGTNVRIDATVTSTYVVAAP